MNERVWPLLQLRRLADCMDYVRVPLNAEERAQRPGSIPYWGANKIQGYVDNPLVTQEVVLLGEDGAPFFDWDRPVAFHSKQPIWPNNHIHVLRPHDGVDARWLTYALNTVDYTLYVAGSTRDKLTQGSMLSILLPTPRTGTQTAIADFLDRETAQIDTLIAKQEQLIETLRERRLLVIRHAIRSPHEGTDGFDKLGRRTRIGNGSTPRRDNTEYWNGGTHPWLNSAAVNQWRVRDFDQFVTPAALSECHLPSVPTGSVLVGLTGQGRTRGMAAVLEKPATVSQHIAYIAPLGDYWDGYYLAWALTAAYEDLRRLSDQNGSTKGGLTCEDLKQYRLCMPELSEQRITAARLDDETSRIDNLIAKADQFVTLAKERRAALITAAVTGQIDVSKAA